MDEFYEDFTPAPQPSAERPLISLQDARDLLGAPDDLTERDVVIAFFERGILIYLDDRGERVVKLNEVLAALRYAHAERRRLGRSLEDY